MEQFFLRAGKLKASDPVLGKIMNQMVDLGSNLVFCFLAPIEVPASTSHNSYRKMEFGP